MHQEEEKWRCFGSKNIGPLLITNTTDEGRIVPRDGKDMLHSME